MDGGIVTEGQILLESARDAGGIIVGGTARRGDASPLWLRDVDILFPDAASQAKVERRARRTEYVIHAGMKWPDRTRLEHPDGAHAEPCAFDFFRVHIGPPHAEIRTVKRVFCGVPVVMAIPEDAPVWVYGVPRETSAALREEHRDAAEAVQGRSRGLGDTVAKAIHAATAGAVKPCGRCRKRQEALNRRFPYRRNRA